MANLNALHAAMTSKGIRRIVFVRHASAVKPHLNLPDEDRPMLGGPEAYETPHDWKRDDQKRPLTELGGQQCQAARGWFLGYPMRLEEKKTALIASGARRATETLSLMAERDVCVSILMCPSLHPAGIAPVMEGMFTTIGYGAIEQYLKDEAGQAAVAEYAEIVCGEIANTVAGLGVGQDTAAVFGHAVFLNAVALYMVGGVPGQAAIDAPWYTPRDGEVGSLMAVDLGEAQGLLFDLATGFAHMFADVN